MEGFEPSTSRFRRGHSGQAELHAIIRRRRRKRATGTRALPPSTVVKIRFTCQRAAPCRLAPDERSRSRQRVSAAAAGKPQNKNPTERYGLGGVLIQEPMRARRYVTRAFSESAAKAPLPPSAGSEMPPAERAPSVPSATSAVERKAQTARAAACADRFVARVSMSDSPFPSISPPRDHRAAGALNYACPATTSTEKFYSRGTRCTSVVRPSTGSG